MKKLLTALLALCVCVGGALGLSACTEQMGKVPEEWGNVLVVYFSATGNTENVANYIASATDGDIFELVPADPYTSHARRAADDTIMEREQHSRL